jgi:hypothetical protein
MSRTTLALIAAVLFGAVGRDLLCGHAQAEPQPAVDRQLVERGVRALEAQVKATEALTRVEERCRK